MFIDLKTVESIDVWLTRIPVCTYYKTGQQLYTHYI